MVGKKRKNKKSKDKSNGKPAPVPPRGPLPLPRAWEPSSKQKLFEEASRQRIISCFPKDWGGDKKNLRGPICSPGTPLGLMLYLFSGKGPGPRATASWEGQRGLVTALLAKGLPSGLLPKVRQKDSQGGR